MRISSLLFLPAFLALWALPGFAQNTAFRPGQLWNDVDGNRINAHGGGIYHESGTYYWFGEKRNRGASGGINVYSSQDLYNWKFERLALAHDSTKPQIRPGALMERPKVIRNALTGKYVMWFHLEIAGAGYDSAYAGIAVSDSVTGPYAFIGGFRPRGNMARDQTLFTDHDGSVYHFYSSNDNYSLRVHALTPDGLLPARDTLLFSDHREAPAVFRHGNTYHLITSGATGWTANAAQWHTAGSIWGPWTPRGNPAKGIGASSTFNSQSSFVLKVPGYENAYVYIGDRWTPSGPDGVEGSFYVWLPLRVQGDSVSLEWTPEWTLQQAFGAPTVLKPEAEISRRERPAPRGSISGLRVPHGAGWRDATGRRVP